MIEFYNDILFFERQDIIRNVIITRKINDLISVIKKKHFNDLSLLLLSLFISFRS